VNKKILALLLTSYILSLNSIPPPRDKTCFWARCRPKREMLCPLFFTEISLSGFVELYLLQYFTVLLRDSETICVQFNSKPKRGSYTYCTSRWIPTVDTTLTMEHIFFTEKSICTCHTNTQFSTDTFLLIIMVYLTSMTYRVLGGETEKKASWREYHPLYTNNL
jgi:hypothetical protein